MDPELFLKDLLQQWDRPLAWLQAGSLEELARLKGRHEVVNWIRVYFDEKRKD